MKVNMNVIVGGTDDMLIDILSAARTVRKEIKNAFESIEIDALQKMDICVCLAGIYQNTILNREFIRQDIILKPKNLLYMFISVLMSGIPIRKKM